MRQLTPWWENISKRQVKAPKIYLTDSGLLHTLLGLTTKEELEGHPKVGASWEGFAMNTVLTQLNVLPEEFFYWSTFRGAKLDLLIMRGNKRIGFEFKRTMSPTLTRFVSAALADLQLSPVYIINASKEICPLRENVTAVGLSRIDEVL